MPKTNFLCTSCRRVMCDDCKEIADEYAELLTLKNRALSTADHTIKELRESLDTITRRAQTWEELSKMGMPEIVIKWMDSQTPESLSEKKTITES